MAAFSTSVLDNIAYALYDQGFNIVPVGDDKKTPSVSGAQRGESHLQLCFYGPRFFVFNEPETGDMPVDCGKRPNEGNTA
jgi:hypothetical protein